MARLISISDDVYGSLKKIKGKSSFTVVIKDLLSQKSNKERILSYFGKGGVDEKAVKDLRPAWRKWSERYA